LKGQGLSAPEAFQAYLGGFFQVVLEESLSQESTVSPRMHKYQ
jgi:hypothetical protein